MSICIYARNRELVRKYLAVWKCVCVCRARAYLFESERERKSEREIKKERESVYMCAYKFAQALCARACMHAFLC